MGVLILLKFMNLLLDTPLWEKKQDGWETYCQIPLYGRNRLSDTPLWEKLIPAFLIHYDSTSAIAKVQNRYYNGKRRQIRRKHITVRDYLSNGAVRVDHIWSEENLADLLTKGLAWEKVWKTSKGIELKPVENWVICDNNPTYKLEIPRNKFKG